MRTSRETATIALMLAALTLNCGDATSGSPVASIRFSAQPPGAVAGQAMAFTIELVDASGERVTSFDDDVIVTLGAGASATGERTVPARSGLATIDDFVVTAAGDNHVLSASARGLTAVSLPFSVTPGPVSAERSSVATPSNQSLLANTPRAVVFTFTDEYGNPIPRAEVSVTSDLAGATFSPTGGRTTTQGTFQTTYRPPAVGTARFSAILNGQSIALPTTLPVISPCTPTVVTLPATMTGTLIGEQGCIVGGAPFQFFRFTMPTSGGVSMDVESPFGAEFEVRGDPTVPTVRLVAVDTTINRQYLLPAGSFEFRIGAFAGQGSYKVTAAVAPANRDSVVRIIPLPGTYTGQTLAAGDFFNSVGSFADAFAIFSSRPCTITVRSTAFDPFIVLTNTFGISVGFDDNSGGGTDAQITRTSCTSSGGAIRIDVASTDLGTGPYTLIIAYN